MGDMSEFRGVIVIGTFFILFGTLIMLVPTGLIASSLENNNPTYNYTDFNPRNLISYNSTYTIEDDDLTEDPTLGWWVINWGKAQFGHDMRFLEADDVGFILNQHLFGFWESHNMNWESTNGIDRGENLYAEEMTTDYDTTLLGSSYIVSCEHFYMSAFITYNHTAYSNFTDAITAHDLILNFGIDFDQQGTTIDTWSLISGIMLFDLPGGISGNIWVYGLISVPLWLAGIYLTFIFVLRIIGALFGGGA